MADQLDEIINRLKNQGQPVDKDSDFYRVIEYFVSKDGIRGKTKITPAQRNMIWVFDLWHKRHPTWGLGDAAESLAVLLISEDGQSRHGMIELFKGLSSRLLGDIPPNQPPGGLPPGGRKP